MDTHKFKKVARGGILFSSGTIVGTALQFIGGIIVIRIVTPAEYGLISLATVVISFVVAVALLGIESGLPRLIAGSDVSCEKKLVPTLVGTALKTVGVAGIVATMLIYFTVDKLAVILNEPEIDRIIIKFSLMIFPLMMISVLTGLFRGLENVKPKIIFQDILLNITRITMFALIAVLGFGFDTIVVVYAASAWLVFILYAAYTVPRLGGQISFDYQPSVLRKMLLLSVPLLGVNLMNNLMTWATTLSVSYFQTAEEIAFISVPLRIASVIPLPLLALVFTFMPVATKLTADSDRGDLRTLYTSTTKWACLITLPLSLYILIDAEYLLSMLFGDAYQHSANIMRILVLGYAVHSFLGPNGSTLVAFGDTRRVFIGAFLAAVLTVIICTILVPSYGALGAAFGISIALIVSNCYMTLVLFLKYKIHPFARTYITPLIVIGFFMLAMYFVFSSIAHPGWITHSVTLLFIVLSVLLAPFITRTVTSDDIALLSAIEYRVHGSEKFMNWVSARII